VVGLENPLRIDTVVFQDVTQESRDVSGLVAQEVLVTRGGGPGSDRSANFASTMVLDEGKSQFFVTIVKGVEDRVVCCTKCRIRRSPSGHKVAERRRCFGTL